MEYSQQFNDFIELVVLYYKNPRDPKVKDLTSASLKSFTLHCQGLLEDLEIHSLAEPFCFPLQLLPTYQPEDLPGWLSSYYTGPIEKFVKLAPRVNTFPKNIMTIDVFSNPSERTTELEPCIIGTDAGPLQVLEIKLAGSSTFKSYLISEQMSYVPWACNLLGKYYGFDERKTAIMELGAYNKFPKMLSHKQGKDMFSFYRLEPHLLDQRISEAGHYVALFIHDSKGFMTAKRTHVPKIFKHCLEFPAGKADLGLTLVESMRKEAKEECSVKFQDLKSKYFFSYFHIDERGNTSNVHIFFEKMTPRTRKNIKLVPSNPLEACKNEGFYYQSYHIPKGTRLCPVVALVLDFMHGQLGRFRFWTDDLAIDRPGFETYGDRDLIILD